MSSEKKFESAPNVAESSQSDTQSIRSEDMVPYELKRKQNIKELGQLFPKENLPSSSTVIQPPQKKRVAIQPPSRKSSRIAEKYLKIQKRTAWKKRNADSWLNPTPDMSSWRVYMEEFPSPASSISREIAVVQINQNFVIPFPIKTKSKKNSS